MAGGTLHVEGVWQSPESVGNFSVSGARGGKSVAALVCGGLTEKLVP